MSAFDSRLWDSGPAHLVCAIEAFLPAKKPIQVGTTGGVQPPDLRMWHSGRAPAFQAGYASSILVFRSHNGVIAQSVEQLHGMQQARGSTPRNSTGALVA